MFQSLFLKRFLSIISMVLFAFNANAQFTATWALTTNKTVVVAGVQSINIVAASMVPGSNMPNPGNHTTSGYEAVAISGYIPNGTKNYWPTTFNDSSVIYLPISPNTGADIVINSLNVTTKRSNSSKEQTAIISYQKNGVGAWVNMGTMQTTTGSNSVFSFTGLTTTFYNGNTYKIRMQFAAAEALKTDDTRVLSLKNLVITGTAILPPSIAPLVVTGNKGAATKYNNTITASNYTISNAGINIRKVSQSGICYATIATPTIANNITNDIATNAVAIANFNTLLNGLSPATTYYFRAYTITDIDTVYGLIDNFTTLPPSKPTLNTNAPTNILSTKATTGGNTIDSGGYAVLEKGVLYATINSNLVYPATGQTKATSDGTGNANFVTTIKGLLPNTKYFIKAYARNSLGAGYGNLDSFTTAAPVANITVAPSNLDFGDVTYNSSQPILSYKVNASYLSPSGGSITLTPTNSNYTICTTLNGVYVSSIPLAYSGGTITNKIIYVKSITNTYGALTGNILHSGGGTVTPNADTTFLTTNVVQNADTLSNAGSDFWCGFGYQEKMKDNTTQFDTLSGSGNSKGAHLSLFIAAGNQGDSVVVELPGISNAPTFPRKVYVPASGFVEIGGFPVGDGNATNSTNGPDTRLYYTGVSKRGIHIYSKSGVPVSAWLYDWNVGDAAAGAMLFPSNTWNSSYVVQAVGGKANSNGYNNNSFFFVIAKDDNTVVMFKPTNDILDSNSATIFSNGHSHTPAFVKYQKDSTYSIILNKGEVFNAMGFVGDPAPASADPGALDLSGTVVSTTCDKKIAVFGGNGRCVLGTAGSNPTVGNPNCNSPSSGSDNLIQQMFPKVAWGTTYLTVPTKNMADNLFRVYIQDINTDVRLNGTLLLKANLIKGLYYQFDINRPSKIESNIPVSVTQFIVSGACQNAGSGNIGKGDPEMITLSPVQQSIKSTTVYSAIFKNGNQPPSNGSSYLNIVVKGFDGVSSFKLDGLTSGIDTGGNSFTGSIYAPSVPANLTNVNAFRKHPYDTSYYYATFRVASKTKHTLFSTQGFNAIAYGVSDGESYGYNAGTTINNLSAIKFSLNPYGSDTATGSVKTCKGNLVTLQIALPYDTTTVNNIVWDAGSDGTLYLPTGAQAGMINPNTSKPQVVGTIVRDGRTFYIYKSPAQYTFFEEGAYKVKVSISGTFVSDCGGTDVQYINVIVGHDDISFTATQAGCGSKNVTIADASTPLAGTTILKWAWNFGDGSAIDTARFGIGLAPNPSGNPHTYPANNAYYVKLTTINSVGCFSYDSVLVDLAFTISSSFTTSKDTICVGENVSFTPTSSANAAKWFWDFGDATIDSSNAAPNTISHSYTTAGTYIISHYIKTAAGCPSAVVKDTVVVSKTPIASFVTPAGVCLPGNTQFINSSDTSVAGAALPYTYHWSFGTGNAGDTSNIKNPIFGYTIAPPNAVTLVATSRFGCVSAVYSQIVNNVFVKPTAVIANTSDKKACVGSNANFFDASFGTNQTVNSWYWNFGDGGIATTKDSTHRYATNTNYKVKLVIGTDKGCVSDTTTWIIKVNPKPKANTILPSSCIGNAGSLFRDTSLIAMDDSIQTPFTYTWNFGEPSSGANNTSTLKDDSHTYAAAGTYYINHSLTTVNGCTDTKKDTFVIAGSKPVPLHFIPNPNVVGIIQYCSNQTVFLRDSSTVSIGSIKKVEIYWDIDDVFGAGLNTNPTIDNAPQNGLSPVTTKVYTFKYPYPNSSKYPRIRIVNYNDNNCYSEDTINITIYAAPLVKFDTIRGICVNGTPKLINFAHDSTGSFDIFNYIKLVRKPTYSGAGVYNDSMFNPAIADTGLHYIKCVYETKLPFNNHCIDSGFAPIMVWALPIPAFTTTTPLCEGNTMGFIDNSIPGRGSGNTNKWLWNFGNPTSGTKDTSTQRNPLHTYTAYGTYNVTLTATSDSGCTATLAPPKAVNIHPKPKVGFISPNGTCAGTPVGFTDTSKIADGTESQFTHYWNFGDPASLGLNTQTGNPLTNPSHLYTSTPTDSVKLIVKSIDGCKDSFAVKLSNSIFPIQTPGYLVNGVLKDTNEVIRVCLGNGIKFSSSIAANNFYWAFGDTVSIINNSAAPTHTYPNVNTFKGSFYVDDNNGCRSKTVPINVEIWALPIPVIKVSDTTCQKSAVTFTSQSIAGAGTGNIKSLMWNFGDLNTSTSKPTATHIYNATGTYNVTLTATSDSGCVATSATPTAVIIHSLPKVKFGLPTKVCLQNELATFTDSSTIADGSEAQFTHTWNFGDPASLADNIATGKPLTTATHNYTVSSNYFIKLVVESKDHCIDSSLPKLLSASILHPKTHADYSVNKPIKLTPTACLGTAITFKDSSGVGVAKSYWIWGDQGFVPYIGTPQTYYDLVAFGSYNGMHFIDDNFGCRSDTLDFVAMIDSFPVIQDGFKYILEGSSAILTPTVSGATNFLWTPINPIGLTNDYLDFNDVENPLCTPILDSVVYRIDVKNDIGCAAPPKYYTVKILHTPIIPNAFSPNGDNVNDHWDISSLQYYPGANVQVFNRYGQVVLNRFGYIKPWDGNDVNGKPLPVGVYYYIIKPGSGLSMMTGSVTILR